MIIPCNNVLVSLQTTAEIRSDHSLAYIPAITWSRNDFGPPGSSPSPSSILEISRHKPVNRPSSSRPGKIAGLSLYMSSSPYRPTSESSLKRHRSAHAIQLLCNDLRKRLMNFTKELNSSMISNLFHKIMKANFSKTVVFSRIQTTQRGPQVQSAMMESILADA
jgi:hypothetical protein